MRHVNSVPANGLWLVTGAAILWGTIGVATKGIYAIDSTSSLFINLARMLIATPILLIGCWHVVGRSMFDIRRRDLLIMIISGASLAVSQAAYFTAIRYIGVTIATLLTLSVTPLMVSFLSVAITRERPTRRVGIAMILALIGGVLLVGVNEPQAAFVDLPSGALFSMISAGSYAITIFCARFLADGYHPLQVTGVSFAAGTAVLMVINVTNGIVLAHTAQGWMLLVYLGLVPTALAYWLFQRGLLSVSATSASIVSMLEPLVAAVLAWGLFGETLPSTGFAGALLLLLSIMLLSGGNQTQPETVITSVDRKDRID
jgi:drug/metabolite transporter, DME family